MMQQKWMALATVVAEKAARVHGLHRYVPKSKTVNRVNFRYLKLNDKVAYSGGFVITLTVAAETEFGKALVLGAISKKGENWAFKGLCDSENPAFYELCKKEAELL